jgi:hypothetical protein
LLLAMTAEKFGCRPSQMAGLRDPVVALDFDLAAAARLLERDRQAASELAGGEEGSERANEILW